LAQSVTNIHAESLSCDITQQFQVTYHCWLKHVPFRGVNCSDAAGNEVDYGAIIKAYLPRSLTGRQWDKAAQSPFFILKVRAIFCLDFWLFTFGYLFIILPTKYQEFCITSTPFQTFPLSHQIVCFCFSLYGSGSLFHCLYYIILLNRNTNKI